MQANKFKHFYLNKYLVTPFTSERYMLCYDYVHKAIWFRVPKVASRTINEALQAGSEKKDYIYASKMGYSPAICVGYFKFAFVRHPEERLLSAWRDKVLRRNHFHFDEDTHEKYKEIEHFVDWLATQDIEDCDVHIKSQHAQIDLNHLDFLGRMENFEEDFNYVVQKLELSVKKAGHLNKTPKAKVELEKAVQRKIYQIYNCLLYTSPSPRD